jgi:PAS domain S-box-containing protein
LTPNNELTHLMELNALILDSVGEGVYGIDKNGNTTFSNPAAEKITGWTKQDLMEKNSHSVWHHSHADGHHYPAEDCPIYAALHDGLIHHEQEEVFWRKDGSNFSVEYTSTPMMSGRNIVGAVVVFKDISQRKKHEKSLQAALSKITQLQKQLEAENTYLKDEITQNHQYGHIIGNHPSLLKVLEEVSQVAPTDASVLINGETGTGKELIARAVHDASNRRDRPLIKVNCGAISENLVESELFGHEKGAFTGAISERQGRFELADGGTLFLDEVAELPKATQTKLLRVLQEQEFERVGGSKTIKVNVRIIAASHKDLAKLSESGEFRQDLFYRLNVFPLFLPALRERGSDVPLLTDWLLANLAKKLGKTINGICNQSKKRMAAYSWPGNIRELQNVLERSAILARESIMEIPESAFPVTNNSTLSQTDLSQLGNSNTGHGSLASIEKHHIQSVLEKTNWKVSGEGGAAEILDMHPNTLRSRMEKLAIKR